MPDALPCTELQVAGQLDLPPALVAVLRRRGHSDPAIVEILEPAPAPPPEQHFPDLSQAVERLQRAISGGETVAICGDYDADGMTSTALLMGVVQRLGGVATAAIPSRMEEGYGLNPAMVERLHQEGVGLLVTVDNGISARPALEQARSLGVEVIVTDHHAIPAQPPPYLALLHPALTPAQSPYRALAGVGLAYLLARCLCQHNPAALAGSQDLFCIGTVADMAPLHGVNRLWLRQGLARLHQSSLPGLQALIRSAGLAERPLDEEDIGFHLAPRINAVGRLGDPRHVVELLTTPSEQRAMAMAQFCEDLNQQRRELCAGIEAEALALLESDGIVPGGQEAPPFLLLAQNHWHHGVIGIVAARLMERFGRPVALLAGDDKGRFRASVRAPRWFAVDAALQSCGELLEVFGGHPAAGGFTVASHRVACLQERLEQRAATALQQGESAVIIAPEAHLSLEQINGAFLKALRSLAPFGVGHPAPLFWAHNCRVLRQQALRGGHRRFEVACGEACFPAIAWRWPHGPAPQQVDVVFRIGWDRRGRQPQLQLEVKALRDARRQVVLHKQGRRYWCWIREGGIQLRNASGHQLTVPWPLPNAVTPDPDAQQPPLHPYVRQLAIQAATALGLAVY
ncbi:MAG: single-stranded DNA-binding protein [Candidatus Synechococcus spongiarum 142]|uniref:Single-stranded-DNA-specific exonuclease RecJ n=1 Tax=Candidatus Synechococcus spongiarum 142 TaxID=1608213 RepID=A0A6N3X4B6_9SYNE|nr:MAG: single-stranded DNA-binding protein [Candidatus Synechococcus spongiarum 142]